MNLLRSIKNVVAPKPRRRSRSEHKSQPEVLETRALLSNVSVTVKSGDLTVKGDSGNNEILISGVSAGTVRVQGLNGTDINGGSGAFTFRMRDDVRLTFKGGNNRVLLAGVVADDVSYKGGHGKDDLGVRDGSLNNLSVKTSGGNDRVVVQRVGGVDSININTGGGRDDIGVADVEGDLTINSGHGNDGVLVVSSNQRSGNIKTGGGNDYVALFTTAFTRDVNVKTGHGADEVWVTGSSIGGTLNVHAGGDTDAVMQESSSVSNSVLKSYESDSITNAFDKALAVSNRLLAIWNY